MIKKLLVICALGLSISCASSKNAPPTYTPTTINQYNLTQLSDAIGTLQLAAENAVPKNILKVNTARVIVQFCVGANTAIKNSPNGWKNTVITSYAYAKSQLTPDELMKFSSAFAAFEVVLNSF